MELPKNKWECYTDEDPEEDVIMETLEVEASATPIEDDYEPEPKLPFPVRKAQLEYLNKEHPEEENKGICNIQVKPATCELRWDFPRRGRVKQYSSG